MKDLNLYVTLRAFDKVSKQFEGIRSAGGRLSKSFDKNLAGLHKINEQMKIVNGYHKQEKALAEAADKMDKAKLKAREFKDEWRKAQQAVANGAAVKNLKKLADQHEKATRTVNKLAQEHRQLKDKLGQASSKLKEAGISSKNLATTQENLRKRASALNDTLDAQSAKLTKVAERQGQIARAKQAFAGHTSLAANASMVGYVGFNAAHRTASTMANMIMPGIEFDAQMARVAAVSRIDKSSPEYKALREQAKQLGATTMFSGSQAAAGQEFLARAGFNQQAIINAMPEVLALAQANGMEDLGQVSDIASNIAGAFKIDPSDTKSFIHLTDVLTHTTTTANVDLAMLGDTMKYLAQSTDLGLSLEQAAAFAGIMGDVGIQGTMSGTALRAMLNRSASQVKDAKKVMDKYGISFTETGDKMKDFENILESVNKATKGMGNAKRAEVIKKIFGTEAVSAITALLNAHERGNLQEKIRAKESNIDGLNRKAAAEMSDTAKGDLLALKSAWEGLQIDLFEGNTSPIRELLQDITKYIRATAKWIKENPELTKQLAKLLALFVALSGAFGALMLTIAPLITGIGLLRFGFGLLTFKSAGFSKQAADTAAKSSRLTRTFKWLWRALKKLVMTPTKWLWHLTKGFGKLNWILVKGVGRALVWLPRVFTAAAAALGVNPILAAVAAIAGAAYLIYRNWDKIVPFFAERWRAVRKWFSETWQLLETDTWSGLKKIGAAILNWSPLGMVYKAFAGVMRFFGFDMPDDLTTAMRKTGQKICDEIMAIPFLNAIISIIGDGIDWATKKIDSLWQTLVDLKNKITGLFTDNEAMPSSEWQNKGTFGAAQQAAEKQRLVGQAMGVSEAFKAEREKLDKQMAAGTIKVTEYAQKMQALIESVGGEDVVRIIDERSRNLGAMTVGGVIIGIDQDMPKAYQKGFELGQTIANGFKAAQDIHSPSRVMKALGRFIPQGLAIGIDQDAHRPLAVMHNIAEALVQPITGDAAVNIAGKVQPKRVEPINHAPSFASAEPRSAAGHSITININGNASKDDAASIAAEVERVLKRVEREKRAQRTRALYDQ